MIEFAWDDILQFEVDSDQMTFNFEYHREGRKPRLVRIFTPYVSPLLFVLVFFCVFVCVYFVLTEVDKIQQIISPYTLF